MTLDHALAAAGRGWSVFPVRRDKVPTLRRWTTEATRDPRTITAWLAGTDLNYGIACGPSGLLVIDEDEPGGLEKYAAHIGQTIPDTFTVATGRGVHYYFNANGHQFGNAEHALKGYGVNVRGNGGYVVGPGSTHANGTVYRVTHDRSAAPLPSWLRDALTPNHPKVTTVDAQTGRGMDALPETIGEGQRHPTLLSYAGSLRHRHVPMTEAVELFRLAWQRCQQPPAATTAYTWDEGLALLQDVYKRYEGGEAYADQSLEPRTPRPRTLDDTRAAFVRWLGPEYDLTVLDIVLAVAASEQLSGDPAWLLVVSGPGAAKTETVIALAGAGATVTSTITSEGALLSGTANKERAKSATGGLLRKIGTHGVLVIKDMTSVLSMNRDARASVLAALREVYDGMWERNLGVDGGQTLRWSGRLVLIGAVTTAWDKAHGVVSSMGDRFLLVRLDSTTGRVGAGRQAIRNTGDEATMRAELADAVGGLLGTVDPTASPHLTDDEVEQLLALANVVTSARTGVERDYRGDVIDAHAPEMPTRFAKQLTQVVRGALALSMDRDYALLLARRCAADSVPPLRLAVLLDLLTYPSSTTHAVRKRLDRPRATVDRELQALHMLGLLTVNEVDTVSLRGDQRSTWYYSLAEDTDAETVRLLGGARNVSTSLHPSLLYPNTPCADISGTTPDQPPARVAKPLPLFLRLAANTTRTREHDEQENH